MRLERFFLISFLLIFTFTANSLRIYEQGGYDDLIKRYESLLKEVEENIHHKPQFEKLDELRSILQTIRTNAIHDIPGYSLLIPYLAGSKFLDSRFEHFDFTKESKEAAIRDIDINIGRKLQEIDDLQKKSDDLSKKPLIKGPIFKEGGFADLIESYTRSLSLAKQKIDKEHDNKSAEEFLNKAEDNLLSIKKEADKDIETYIGLRAYLSGHDFFPGDKIYEENRENAKKYFEEKIKEKEEELKKLKERIKPVAPSKSMAEILEELKKRASGRTGKEAEEFKKILANVDVSSKSIEEELDLLDKAYTQLVLGGPMNLIQYQGFIKQYNELVGKSKPTTPPSPKPALGIKQTKILEMLEDIKKNKNVNEKLTPYFEILEKELNKELLKKESEIDADKINEYSSFFNRLTAFIKKGHVITGMETTRLNEELEDMGLEITKVIPKRKPVGPTPVEPKPSKPLDQRIKELSVKIEKLPDSSKKSELSEGIRETDLHRGTEDSDINEQKIKALEDAFAALEKNQEITFTSSMNRYKAAAAFDLRRRINHLIKVTISQLKPKLITVYRQYGDVIKAIENKLNELSNKKLREITTAEIDKYEEWLRFFQDFIGVRLPNKDESERIDKIRKELGLA